MYMYIYIYIYYIYIVNIYIYIYIYIYLHTKHTNLPRNVIFRLLHFRAEMTRIRKRF